MCLLILATSDTLGFDKLNYCENMLIKDNALLNSPSLVIKCDDSSAVAAVVPNGAKWGRTLARVQHTGAGAGAGGREARKSLQD